MDSERIIEMACLVTDGQLNIVADVSAYIFINFGDNETFSINWCDINKF